MIPEGWKCVPLDDVAVIQTGVAKGKSYSAKTVRVPYLRVANVQDGYLDLSEIKEIEVLPSEVERYRLQYEDVLLTEGGDFDKLGRGDIWRGEIPLCLHQNHIFVVRTKREFLDPYFFTYQTSSPYGKQYFLASSKQSTNLASINSTQLREFPVLLPPLAEQRKIAAILSIWDAAVTLTRQLNAALQQRKQALMQLLLTGAVRFPEFEDEWEEVELGEFAEVNPESLGEKTEADYEFFYIDLSSVNQGVIAMPSHKIRYDGAPSRARRVLHFGDVIMSTVRPNLLGFALCDFKALDVICSTGFALLSPRDLRDSNYLYQNLYSGSLLKQVQDLVTGSNYPAINANEVKRLRLPFPLSIHEREKIGETLRSCDTETQILGQLIDKLKEQKRGLMQQLLTGAVRVQADEP